MVVNKDVKGSLYILKTLSDHWVDLDKFECEAYTRVLAKMPIEDGRMVDAHVFIAKPTL